MEEKVMRCDLVNQLPVRPFPPEITLTTWQPDVADQFFQAYHAAFRERPGFPGYSAEEWITDKNEDENLVPGWTILARIGDQPVGFLTAGSEHPGGFISQVGVIPEQRRRGICSALICESMRRMKFDGDKQVQLAVHINNPGAFKAYAGLGFVTTGRRARYVRKGLLFTP
jgi:ribosomal protein S18 acetylase RimI-like enzyme